ncbi:MAG TPA: universal stress protein [Streptosporangiaceae bacterium]|nr:universal stress protein [Streptosporangiaceae bacterium]
MDRSGQQPVILVGVSGSGASLAALHWAAQEARRQGAALRVIEAWQSHPARAHYAAAGNIHVRVSEAMAVAHLAAEVRAVVGEPASVDMTVELAEGTAERILADASADASLLVLGAGSLPSYADHVDSLPADRPVGPVIRACLSHARCPVVVIGPMLAAQQAVSMAARTAGRR